MFQNNEMVKISKNGQQLEGVIVGKRTYADLDPSYCDSQEVDFKIGRMGWGYRVRAPIVLKDGTAYMDRNGKPLLGLSYVDEKLISKK